MKIEFDLIKFIRKVCSYSPRLGKNEQLTAKYIEKVLSSHKVCYKVQKFRSTVPIIKKAKLTVDGKNIECKGSSLVSGKIIGKDNIISSLKDIDGQKIKYNINFNPLTKHISVADFYEHNAVTIKNADKNKIINANKVMVEVIVKKYRFISKNILVGNSSNPKFLVFAHYDCIGFDGAVDNASGVGAVMYAILKYPDLLDNTLFVFSGSEELSYDKYSSDGLGFRVFEQTFSKQMNKCKRIYVLDGVGNGNPHFTQNYDLLNITLQIKSLPKVKKKVFLMQGDEKKINQIYHTDFDTIDQLMKIYLIKSSELLLKDIKRNS